MLKRFIWYSVIVTDCTQVPVNWAAVCISMTAMLTLLAVPRGSEPSLMNPQWLAKHVVQKTFDKCIFHIWDI